MPNVMPIKAKAGAGFLVAALSLGATVGIALEDFPLAQESNSSSSEAKRTIWPSRPPSGVATLPPRAVRASVCETGDVTRPVSTPLSHTLTVAFSARTLENPWALSRSSVSATAARSPVEPASLGPARSLMSRTQSAARDPADDREPEARSARSAVERLEHAGPLGSGDAGTLVPHNDLDTAVPCPCEELDHAAARGVGHGVE